MLRIVRVLITNEDWQVVFCHELKNTIWQHALPYLYILVTFCLTQNCFEIGLLFSLPKQTLLILICHIHATIIWIIISPVVLSFPYLHSLVHRAASCSCWSLFPSRLRIWYSVREIMFIEGGNTFIDGEFPFCCSNCHVTGREPMIHCSISANSIELYCHLIIDRVSLSKRFTRCLLCERYPWSIWVTRKCITNMHKTPIIWFLSWNILARLCCWLIKLCVYCSTSR